MRVMQPALKAHLESGVTSLCHAWAITRRDGTVYGFTDHDRALAFEGLEFRADTGLSAMALQQSTGLAVDNTEALGALSDAAIREADIEAGRFDGAEVRAWLVNWQDVRQRIMQFRGTIGELKRTAGGFRAEVRGLTEALNQPLGRVYQKPCTAVLGDRACGFDQQTAGYVWQGTADAAEGQSLFRFEGLNEFEPGWFERGTLSVESGVASGLRGMIKRDRFEGDTRVVELWQPLRADVRPGDMLRLDAGCDKRMQTCRLKFNNLVNFQGFPDLPGEDWMMAQPVHAGNMSGGSRR